MTKDEALKLALEALYALAAMNHTTQQMKSNAITAIKEALAQEQEPVRLRRGNILRCIETNELCTVWSTSTTGKTLVKWGANSFGEYTAEQIGELFWLEPEPDNLELAAEKSDNYASFHAGYRFAVAHHLAQPKQEPLAWISTGPARMIHWTADKPAYGDDWVPLYITPPQRKPLTEWQITEIYTKWESTKGTSWADLIRAIEAAHGIKENT